MNSAAFTAWYEKLAPRDQRILRYGAVAVGVIVLLWVLIPLQRSLGQARERLRQQQEDYEWMRRQAPTLVAAGPGVAPGAAGKHESLVVVLDRAARESGLGKAYAGSPPAANGSMRVQFTNADFNLLLGLMHRLSTQQGLRIDDASFATGGGPGLVNASLLLRPGA